MWLLELHVPKSALTPKVTQQKDNNQRLIILFLQRYESNYPTVSGELRIRRNISIRRISGRNQHFKISYWFELIRLAIYTSWVRVSDPINAKSLLRTLRWAYSLQSELSWFSIRSKCLQSTRSAFISNQHLCFALSLPKDTVTLSRKCTNSWNVMNLNSAPIRSEYIIVNFLCLEFAWSVWVIATIRIAVKWKIKVFME